MEGRRERLLVYNNAVILGTCFPLQTFHEGRQAPVVRDLYIPFLQVPQTLQNSTACFLTEFSHTAKV